MTSIRLSPSHPRAICTALRHARRCLCRRLETAVAASDEVFVREFAAIVTEVEAGFRHEEVIMETLGYVHLHEHRAENAVVLSALHHVLPDVERGDHGLGRQVLGALREVLALHRLSSDLALAVAPQASTARARGKAARATQHVAPGRPRGR